MRPPAISVGILPGLGKSWRGASSVQDFIRLVIRSSGEGGVRHRRCGTREQHLGGRDISRLQVFRVSSMFTFRSILRSAIIRARQCRSPSVPVRSRCRASTFRAERTVSSCWPQEPVLSGCSSIQRPGRAARGRRARVVRGDHCVSGGRRPTSRSRSCLSRCRRRGGATSGLAPVHRLTRRAAIARQTGPGTCGGKAWRETERKRTARRPLSRR